MILLALCVTEYRCKGLSSRRAQEEQDELPQAQKRLHQDLISRKEATVMYKQLPNYCGNCNEILLKQEQSSSTLMLSIPYQHAGTRGQDSQCQDAALSSGFGTPRGHLSHSHTLGSCTSWHLHVCRCVKCVCGYSPHSLTYQVRK